ncbi:uncharacterized protein BJ171DRAFT_490890 [Polychytrium aggregatum]|uniref:uncharacterized protein n=1 Tax=Polychytrium aggregatum TaxID=110093 RepID=UPI0022FF2B2F|nr:uncharacterized protein BJ171DRAFT_490890 [Polychytrium aggregatum]KAI9208286.1 hypothetical protein BJ171DRAFT_490890 [Polychytrium aggregatum]
MLVAAARAASSKCLLAHPARAAPGLRRCISAASSPAKLDPAPTSIYIHWPYCEAKCTYCSFNKYHIPVNGQDHDRMLKCIEIDLAHALRTDPSQLYSHLGEAVGQVRQESRSLPWDEQGSKPEAAAEDLPSRSKPHIRSIYFGGGTPSLMLPSTVESICEMISQSCSVDPHVEISLEANPTSMSLDKLSAFKQAGVNRLSLGLQSLNDQDLAFFGRDHSAADGLRSAEMAMRIFDNVSLDMIWGRPGQTVDEWRKELQIIASMNSAHMSLYQLQVERGTPLHKWVAQKQVAEYDSDVLADFYEATRETAAQCGFQQYEVSSFYNTRFAPPRKSRHNTAYWEGHEYIGVGPGAHGRRHSWKSPERYRTFCVQSPNAWMKQCESHGHGVRRITRISEEDAMKEIVVFGLRTYEGVSCDTFERFSKGVPLHQFLDGEALDHFIELGLIMWSQDGRKLRPTARGLAVIDHIVADMI